MTLPRPDDERFWPRRSFGAPPHPYGEYENARVVVLPVPYDSTGTARAGARDGPDAIIAASEDMELYEAGLGCAAYRHRVYNSPLLPRRRQAPRPPRRRAHGRRRLLPRPPRPVLEPQRPRDRRPRRPAGRVPRHALQPRLRPAPHARRRAGDAGGA